MTPQQARWAAQHDWFLQVEGSPHVGLVVVCRDYENAHGEWVPCAVRFDSFSELRAWAGY